MFVVDGLVEEDVPVVAVIKGAVDLVIEGVVVTVMLALSGDMTRSRTCMMPLLVLSK